ncbi:diguanylate cyclase [Orenia marismortui]|uniref:diguanylate cyclase n=1 Tax=Orenia marismortui TaxID=46469 RepID=UPI000380196F|nr:diguanylate cyclase [Orenia marismortui]
MGEITLGIYLVLKLSIFISVTYLITNFKFSFGKKVTDISKKNKFYLNISFILLLFLGSYFLGAYNIGLYYLVIILSGKLLGRPYGLILGLIAAFYSNYLGINLYSFALEAILIGVAIDLISFFDLKNIDDKLENLYISLVLALILIYQDDLIVNFIFNTLTFWVTLMIINNYNRKIQLLKDKEKELEDVSLTCNSLTGLHDINNRMSSNFTLEETYDSLVEIGCEQLGINYGGLLAESEEEGYFDIKSFVGLDRKYLKKMKIKKSNLYFGHPLKESGSVIINSLDKEENEDVTLFIEDGFKSLLISPIFIEGDIKAIVFFLHKEEGFFSNRHLMPIQTIVEQAPLVIEKAHFFEKMERNVAGLSTLQRTSNTINSTLNLDEVINLTVDVVMGTMGVSMSGLFLVNDENEDKLDLVASVGFPQNEDKEKLISLAEEIAWRTIKEDSPLITDEVPKEAKEKFDFINLMSAVIIPLKVRGRVLGVIAAAQVGFKRNFKEADRRFLTTLANQMAIAIENATIYKQMEELATRDGLTKLYNHSYFQNSLRREISMANRYNRELSLIIMDIDNFKDFNDTYGHQVGDEVLKNLARLLEAEARDTDIVARYGGEEFTVILPETDSEGVVIMAERINKRVREMVVSYDNLRLKVTISIGAANYKFGKSQKELISAADNALYQAKENGKDQTCLAE